jgi:hypothetical protein
MLGRTEDPVLAPPERQAGLADAGGPLPGDSLVEFAQRVARGSRAERLAFHAGYRAAADEPGIDSVDVVTELRRLVVLAELQSAAGQGWRDAREAAAALAPYRGRLTIEAQVRFHPQNRYTSVPHLQVQLGCASTMQPALELRAEPIHGAAPLAEGSGPAVVGARVEATFASPPARGVHTLVVHVDHVYLLLATIDLTRMPLRHACRPDLRFL